METEAGCPPAQLLTPPVSSREFGVCAFVQREAKHAAARRPCGSVLGLSLNELIEWSHIL